MNNGVNNLIGVYIVSKNNELIYIDIYNKI